LAGDAGFAALAAAAGILAAGFAGVLTAGFDRAAGDFVAAFFTAAAADDFLAAGFVLAAVDREAGFVVLAAGFLLSAPLIRLSSPGALLAFFAG
jgi:hypothetical protein